MNIFAVSPNTKICARYLDDKRLVKMCLETAQILSGMGYGPYKKTNMNPSVQKWAAKWPEWMVALMLDLCEEYKYRYNKKEKHASLKALETNKKFLRLCKKIKDKGGPKIPTDWPTSYHDKYKGKGLHSFVAYKRTLRLKWKNDYLEKKRPPKWTNRKPKWEIKDA